ncbi:hypothetical protein HOD05_02965 [Candidatus Woesearchaeota archaeon]|nr:hypothetical protein [Candidatus Woesearchaeota archaeon]MBT4151334.1 hypothetical protein [Candidatus Woesearchaeota archaeon]MBT4247429.1 hypothetical protein [Candidatus Woesearchaeota archaeon]MBT4434156.1 hypothetical protein [Candidatus Woesearchaeota archaeon]MBT7332473.1 hypothetical protein [Candidatus Woesearchaeota archaeon]
MPHLDVVVQRSWDRTLYIAHTGYALCGQGETIPDAIDSAIKIVDAHLSWYTQRKKDFPPHDRDAAFSEAMPRLLRGAGIVYDSTQEADIAGSHFSVNSYRIH